MVLGQCAVETAIQNLVKRGASITAGFTIFVHPDLYAYAVRLSKSMDAFRVGAAIDESFKKVTEYRIATILPNMHVLAVHDEGC